MKVLIQLNNKGLLMAAYEDAFALDNAIFIEGSHISYNPHLDNFYLWKETVCVCVVPENAQWNEI